MEEKKSAPQQKPGGARDDRDAQLAELLDTLRPETPIEQALFEEDAFIRGLLWGSPRFGHPEGQIWIRTSRSGRIIGARVFSAHAGEVIGLLSALISQGIKLRALSDTVLPYPTYSEGVGRAGSKLLADRIPDGLIRVVAALTGLRGEHAGFDPDEIG